MTSSMGCLITSFVAIDNDSFIEAKSALLLNGFVKKSTKDYKPEIEKAKRILKRYTYNETTTEY